MQTRQQQVMDSFVRVRAFLSEHPTKGVLTYESAREMLDDALQRLRGYATAQFRGRELTRGEVRRQGDQVQLLFDQHIRPIVTIARAQIEPESDVGLPAALRMPKLPVSASKLLSVCDGMISAAREYEAVFVANGLPADFLAQFADARNALERVIGGRTTHAATRTEAAAGIRVQLRRGRRAVDRLDAIVRASFRNDEATLAAWRGAKRLQLPGGGSTARGVTEVEEVARAA